MSTKKQYKFNVGDKAVVAIGDTLFDEGDEVTITGIDRRDDILPYKAEGETKDGGYDYSWFSDSQLEKVDEYNTKAVEERDEIASQPEVLYIGGQPITDNANIMGDFKDISHEMWRAYRYPGDDYSNPSVVISHPVALRVSASGAHYIVDSLGTAHYISAGFREILWENPEGEVRINF